MFLKTVRFLSMNRGNGKRYRAPRWTSAIAVVASLCLSCGLVQAQSAEKTLALQALTSEREMLTVELEQYEKTLDILQTDGTPPEESSNPAVRKLAREVVRLKERLVAIAEQEVTLLQEQIIDARSREEKVAAVEAREDERRREELESKPLREVHVDYTHDQEAENVERLHELLQSYHTEIQESSQTLPTEDELRRRELAQRDAETLARIPFSADKVRLSGSEGSTALTRITQRLMDPRIPESRRDIAPICTIKTRLHGSLVGSENRSLKPVGKNHYVARIRLQPGDTTLSVLDDSWEIRLPQHANGQDFLVTFYRPARGIPELHVFAVDDLLALERPHLPAWLPEELDIKPHSG